MTTSGMKKGKRWWKDKMMGRKNSRKRTKKKSAEWDENIQIGITVLGKQLGK